MPCFAGEQPLDIYQMASALHETLCDGPELLATTRLSLELGRWLVGESGVYLTRVLDRTESCGETFLTTDGGGHICSARPAVCSSATAAIIPIAVATRFDAPSDEQVTVTGCLATPFDVLGDEVMLPHAETGNLIAIFCAGAYGLTASPQAWESRPHAQRNARLGIERLDEIEARAAGR